MLFIKNRRSIYSLLLFFLLVSCSSTKVTKSSNELEHNYSQAHYERLGSNISRLLEMRQGVFAHYQAPPNGQKLVWPVNEGADSILTIMRPIGNPAKNGYWMLMYMFMTHAPDLPLVVSFQKYEVSPNSRDTIVSTNYFADEAKVTWEQISDPNYTFKDIDFKKDLRTTSDCIIFSKQNLMEFKGVTNLRSTKTHLEEYTLRKDFYTVTPKESVFKVILYSKNKELPEFKEPAIQTLEKLPKDNPFYPKSTAYKNKKEG